MIYARKRIYWNYIAIQWSILQSNAGQKRKLKDDNISSSQTMSTSALVHLLVSIGKPTILCHTKIKKITLFY